jgi:hypothetical protein
MTALEGTAPDLRAILAAHVSLELVDRRRLRPAHNVEGDRLMRVAAETANFEVAVSGVERVAEGRGRLRRPLVAEHSLVPGLAGEPIGLLARLTGALRRRSDRRAIDALAGLRAHKRKDALRGDDPASRYRLRWIIARTLEDEAKPGTSAPASR